jgi:anti-sigma B factor antagonist
MIIIERVFGNVTVLALEGKLILDDGERDLKDRVNALLRQGRKYLVLNMSGVTYLDSCGVGVLAWKYVTTRKQGGTIKLAALGPRSHSPLFISKLLEVFEVYETEGEAVRSFDADIAKTGGFTIVPS